MALLTEVNWYFKTVATFRSSAKTEFNLFHTNNQRKKKMISFSFFSKCYGIYGLLSLYFCAAIVRYIARPIVDMIFGKDHRAFHFIMFSLYFLHSFFLLFSVVIVIVVGDDEMCVQMYRNVFWGRIKLTWVSASTKFLMRSVLGSLTDMEFIFCWNEHI